MLNFNQGIYIYIYIYIYMHVGAVTEYIEQNKWIKINLFVDLPISIYIYIYIYIYI